MRQFTNEYLLLQRLVRSYLRTDCQHVAEPSSPSVNWDRFYHLAKKEGLAGLCHRIALTTSFQQHIPPQVFALLQNSYYQNFVNYLMCEKAVMELLSIIHCPLIFMRGISAIYRLYESPGMRGFSDIDMLTKTRDFENVAQTLLKAGYSTYQDYDHLFHKNGIFIDLHSDVIGISRIKARIYISTLDHEDLWRTSKPVNISGLSLNILSAEYEILILCYHFMKHSFLKLIWLVDIAKLITNTKIDWSEFIKLAAITRMNFSSYYGLQYVNQWAGEVVPPFVLEELHQFKSSSLQQRIIRKMQQKRTPAPFAELLFSLQLPEKIRRFQYLLEAAFPSGQVRKQIFRPYAFTILKVFFFPFRFIQLMKSAWKLLVLLR